jgi:uncharacterized membrane protein YdjX (TVP38/TMEM64 family)
LNRFLAQAPFLALAAAIGTALLWAKARFGTTFDLASLTHHVRQASHHGWALPAYAALFCVGSFLFVPAIVFFALAGATFGMASGFAIGFVCVNVISNIQFALGRAAGQKRLRAFFERRQWQGAFLSGRGEGIWAMLLLRQLPLPFLAVNLGAGASLVRWRHFIVGNALGLLPNSLLYCFFASQVVAGHTQHLGATALAVAAGVVTLTLLARWLVKKFA